MNTLYNSDYIEIRHDLATNVLYVQWFGSQQRQKIIDAGMKILDFVKVNKITRILNDNRAVRGPWLTAAQWAADVWFPQMQDAGLKHFAWVLSPNVFSDLSIKVAIKDNAIVRTFKSFDEAQRWLHSQPR